MATYGIISLIGNILNRFKKKKGNSDRKQIRGCQGLREKVGVSAFRTGCSFGE